MNSWYPSVGWKCSTVKVVFAAVFGMAAAGLALPPQVISANKLVAEGDRQGILQTAYQASLDDSGGLHLCYPSGKLTRKHTLNYVHIDPEGNIKNGPKVTIPAGTPPSDRIFDPLMATNELGIHIFADIAKTTRAGASGYSFIIFDPVQRRARNYKVNLRQFDPAFYLTNVHLLSNGYLVAKGTGVLKDSGKSGDVILIKAPLEDTFRTMICEPPAARDSCSGDMGDIFVIDNDRLLILSTTFNRDMEPYLAKTIFDLNNQSIEDFELLSLYRAYSVLYRDSSGNTMNAYPHIIERGDTLIYWTFCPAPDSLNIPGGVISCAVLLDGAGNLLHYDKPQFRDLIKRNLSRVQRGDILLANPKLECCQPGTKVSGLFGLLSFGNFPDLVIDMGNEEESK